jgi:hypothetical protein
VWLINSLVVSLLGERHKFIRWFVGPGMAFLLRKVPENRLGAVVNYILASLSKPEHSQEEYWEGVAILFFETFKVRSYLMRAG